MFSSRLPQKPILSLILLIASFVAVGTTAKADPVIIDFEGFADSTLLTSQYPNLTFSNSTVLSAGISLNEFEFPPRSGSNVLFDNGGAISISFASPVTSIGGYITYTTPITLTAFDASNNLLGTVTSLFSNNLAISGDFGSTPNEFITFSFAGGISRIVLTGDPLGSSFTLDDLTLNQPVPEPNSISLLVLALGGLVTTLKRRL